MKASLRTFDGLAWLIVTIASFLAIVVFLIALEMFPQMLIKFNGRVGITLTTLAGCPLFFFGLMVFYRQYLFGQYILSEIIRAIVMIGGFVYLIFWLIS